jgi:hypothetical protein
LNNAYIPSSASVSQIDSKVNFTYVCKQGYSNNSWYTGNTKSFSCELAADTITYNCTPAIVEFCQKIACDKTISFSELLYYDRKIQ